MVRPVGGHALRAPRVTGEPAEPRERQGRSRSDQLTGGQVMTKLMSLGNSTVWP